MSLAGKKSVKVWIETDSNKRFKSENSGFVDIRDIISVINRSNTSGKCIAISCNDGFIFSNHIIGVFPVKDDE